MDGLGAVLWERKYPTYLDVLDDAIIADLSLCIISRGGEGVGHNMEKGSIAGIGDGKGSNGDCSVSMRLF
jgi:hypothetical protein